MPGTASGPPDPRAAREMFFGRTAACKGVSVERARHAERRGAGDPDLVAGILGSQIFDRQKVHLADEIRDKRRGGLAVEAGGAADLTI